MSRRPYNRQETRYDHMEHRRKVTLAEFYAKRLNAVSIPYGSIREAYLMSVPAERYGRAKTRDLVPFSDKTLARLSKPFASPVMSFAKAKTGDRLGPLPKYRDWLRSIGALPVKRKKSSAPMFQESAPEAWRDLPCDVSTL